MHSQVSGNRSEDYFQSSLDKLEESFFNDSKSKISLEQYVYRTFSKYKAEPKNYIELRIVLRDLYLKYFNYFNETSNAVNLIGPVLYIDEEELHRPRYLDTLLKTYHENRIRTLFGLNLFEYLSLTPLETTFVLESATKYNEDKELAMSELQEQLNEEMGEEESE